VVLGRGGSLWEVAERFCPPGMDKRAYVDAVMALNQLGSAPQAGTRIELPR
jgi:hypothetical protein